MNKNPEVSTKGSMFGLLQNVIVILLLIGVVYFLVSVMNKKPSAGPGSERSVLEGARDNVDRINAQTRSREDQIEKAMKEKNVSSR